MLTSQNIEALKAFQNKLLAERAKPRQKKRYLYIPGPDVRHRDGTDRNGNPKFKTVTTKRALLVDRSIYTNEILQQWRAINGVGKGLLLLQKRRAAV